MLMTLKFMLVSIRECQVIMIVPSIDYHVVIAEVRRWMLANKLKLNDSKTEFFPYLLSSASRHAV